MRLTIIIGSLLLAIGIFCVAWVCVYGRERPGAYRRGWSLGIVSMLCAGIALYFSYGFPLGSWPDLYQTLLPINILTRSWVGMVGLLGIPLCLLALIRWFVVRQAEKVSPAHAAGRRKFFQWVAIGLPALSFLGIAKTSLETVSNRKVTELTLAFPQLPESLEGYKIGQISDFHLGPYASVEDLDTVFQQFHAAKVTQVVITGDLIDSLSLLPGMVEVLRFWGTRFPEGITYVYGNHEYYRDLDRVTAALKETPVRILRNSHYQLPLAGTPPVYMAGVDFPFDRNQTDAQIEAYLDKAVAGIPPNAFVILLAHHPDFIGAAFARHIPLTLAGHSHGGQIDFFHTSVVPMPYTYWRGLYQATEEPIFGYVSTGAGDWWPLRIQCPREITIFTLRQGTDTNPVNEYP